LKRSDIGRYELIYPDAFISVLIFPKIATGGSVEWDLKRILKSGNRSISGGIA
jgi:hypothetical protein